VDFGAVVTEDGGMRPARILRLTSAVGLALVLLGCGTSADSPGEPDPTSAPATSTSAPTSSSPTASPTLTSSDGKPMRVTMTGTIEDGVESGCLVFTDEATGRTYSLTSDQLPGTALGSRVTVVGTVDPDMLSFCQQGPVLLVDEVTAPAD
jgi:hypothetical protein